MRSSMAIEARSALIALSALTVSVAVGCSKNVRTELVLEPHTEALITFGSQARHEFLLTNDGPAQLRVTALGEGDRVRADFLMAAPGLYGDDAGFVRSLRVRNQSDGRSEL